MSFLAEKQSRHYFLFLCAFSAVLVCTAVFAAWGHGRQTRHALLSWEQAVSSSLLDEGVAPAVIAKAFQNPAVSQKGLTFLRQLGHTEETPLWLLPFLWRSTLVFLLFSFSGALVLGGLLLFFSARWFGRRERLYLSAAGILSRFSEGNFSDHLPGNEPGALYRMFTLADQLATALQSKTETEHQGREFLKDTISDISHQLKTPLAALTMYTEIILDEPEKPDTVREFAQKSMQSLSRMEQLISSLLKMMRLDAGSILFEKARCPVKALAFRAAENLWDRAKAEGKEILLEGDEAETVFCDAEWTGEALGNLLKNALDHMESGGFVRVHWQSSPTMLRIFVTDDGCGIAPEDIHHIFKRFYQSRRTDNRQGAGLGLPLAKAIIEGQGGILSVESEPGAGTTFTISFLTNL